MILLHRPEIYKIFTDENGNDLRGIAELIISKNSGGAFGEVYLKKTEGFTNFVDFDDHLSLIEMKFPKNRLDEIENTNPF